MVHIHPPTQNLHVILVLRKLFFSSCQIRIKNVAKGIKVLHFNGNKNMRRRNTIVKNHFFFKFSNKLNGNLNKFLCGKMNRGIDQVICNLRSVTRTLFLRVLHYKAGTITSIWIINNYQLSVNSVIVWANVVVCVNVVHNGDLSPVIVNILLFFPWASSESTNWEFDVVDVLDELPLFKLLVSWSLLWRFLRSDFRLVLRLNIDLVIVMVCVNIC